MWSVPCPHSSLYFAPIYIITGYWLKVTVQVTQLQVLIKAGRKSWCLQEKKCWLTDWLTDWDIYPSCLCPPPCPLLSVLLLLVRHYTLYGALLRSAEVKTIPDKSRHEMSTLYCIFERPGLVLGQCQISTPVPVMFNTPVFLHNHLSVSKPNNEMCALIVFIWLLL